VPDTSACCACPLQYEHPHERYGMPMGGPHDPKQHPGYGRDNSYSHDETAVDKDYYRQQGGGLERQTSGNYGKSSQKVAGLPDIASSRWVDCVAGDCGAQARLQQHATGAWLAGQQRVKLLLCRPTSALLKQR
jgi:hypothetical protein